MSLVIQNTIMITAFVIVAMLLVEYITVITKGKWSIPIQKRGWIQILLGTILGIFPGCMGAFTAVTLYTHRIVGFPALVACMIATSGDEAFLMFSLMPKEALILTVILFAIAFITGLVLWYFMGDKNFSKLSGEHFEIHEHENVCFCYKPKEIKEQLKKITFERAILIGALLLYIVSIMTGLLEHSHADFQISGDLIHDHEHCEHHDHGRWNWFSITSLTLALFGLFVVSTTPIHFLQEHLWGHIIKKHLLKIMAWTFGAMLFIHVGIDFLDIDHWIKDNYYVILLIAVLIGIIPESGPHIMFISFYLSGTVPFSILLANSIVQDGHGALPLLAESRKSFVLMKIVNLLIGFTVGAVALFFGF